MEHLGYCGGLRVLQEVPHHGPQPPHHIWSEILIPLSLIKQHLFYELMNS